MAVSSAMLLVPSPMNSECSRISPSGRSKNTPMPAGPGFPLHAPSVWMTIVVGPAGLMGSSRTAWLATAGTGAPPNSSSGRISPSVSMRLSGAAR